MTAVNLAIEDEDWEQTYEMLKQPDIALAALTAECAQTYHEQLKEIRTDKIDEGGEENFVVLF